MRLAVLLTLVLSVVIEVRAADDCTMEQLELARTPELARGLAKRCLETPSIRFKALDKLNAMPLPAAIPEFSEKPLGMGSTERASFEVNVFFDVDEAYPIPVGLEKLGDLVRRISDQGVIDLITVSSSENAFEHGASTDVALLRTQFVRRFLVAAGIDASHIRGAQQASDHDDTPVGRAWDRCARVRVFMHRAKPAP